MPIPRRGLAFYKESRTPWTKEEVDKMYDYVGVDDDTFCKKDTKYLYDDGDSNANAAYYFWDDQDVSDCEIVAYEDVFPTVPLFEL